MKRHLTSRERIVQSHGSVGDENDFVNAKDHSGKEPLLLACNKQ